MATSKEKAKIVTELGAELTSARQAMGLSINDVAEKLKIRSDYLEALEASDYDKLPEPVYAIAFAKTYTVFLNLDSDVLCQHLRTKYNKVSDNTPAIQKLDSSTASNNFVPFVIFIAILIAGYMMIDSKKLTSSKAITVNSAKDPVLDVGKNIANEDIGTLVAKAMEESNKTEKQQQPEAKLEPEQQQIKPIENNNKTEYILGIAKAPQPAIIAASEIRLVARDDVWVQITNSITGEVVTKKILQAGDDMALEQIAGHELDIGRPDKLDIYVGETNLGVSGLEGKIIRGLPVDASYIKNIYYGKGMNKKRYKKAVKAQKSE